MTTAHEAVAWTFNVPAKDYAPTMETYGQASPLLGHSSEDMTAIDQRDNIRSAANWRSFAPRSAPSAAREYTPEAIVNVAD
jgi:hypothetical protein